MIWSIPIGFINSVTQYVLIAVNQQRFLTKAFLIGVVFTTVANLLLVPKYGYIAAALIQIPAELSLFIPFSWAVRRYVAPMPWLKMLGGPSLAAGVNAAIVWGLDGPACRCSWRWRPGSSATSVCSRCWGPSAATTSRRFERVCRGGWAAAEA